MWDRLVEHATLAPGLAADLARVQFEVAGLPTSFELPAQRDRIVSKVHLAARQHGEELLRALDAMPPDVGPLVLCHGDLHPRNVLLSPGGEVLVDWFDASRGAIEAEIARTLIMLEDSHEIGPGSEPIVERALAVFRVEYLAAATMRVDRELVDRWAVVQGVARLAEGFGQDRLDVLRSRLARVR
jgi:thiamine kinase-like enzyme